MKTTQLWALLISIMAFVGCSSKDAAKTTEENTPLSIIFDTDMGNDVDDALALDMLYKYMEEGRINLLAIPTTKKSEYCPGYIDIMNTWYGHNIPIGVVENGTDKNNSSHFIQTACELKTDNGKPAFERTVTNYADFLKSVSLYRKVLSGQPDSSVVIVSVGFSTNLAQLLDSQADEYSPLSGKDLVKKKVKYVSAMMGQMQDTAFKEFNVYCDIPSAQKFVNEWPTPIVASPYEVGDAILFPAKCIENDFKWKTPNPLVVGYENYMEMPYDRQTWDMTSVLYVVENDKNFFGNSGPGTISIDDTGATTFSPNANGKHSYLTVNEEQAQTIKDYFIRFITQKPAKYKDFE
ncbi:nucleoside hydrolase [Coprobacter secundus]|uniref:Nucleoside hydrolase n=1 Tax=Coprobacter secundus subsp. similis TaxID=2751153 RepID=A0A7G1HST6_9BACT|nr:nucleoside hydrolase [Coprobacter secundus]BCI62073.1 nucleoside hydrolase [Coprobacter secundus subsp. similis]